MSVKPSLQAMLLADAFYKDGETGKTVLAGIFDEITVPRGETCFRARAYLYLSMTNLLGNVDLVLRYVDLSSNRVIHEYQRAVIYSKDRLTTLEVAIPLPFLPVPHPGAYAMDLYSFEDRIGSLRITAYVV